MNFATKNKPNLNNQDILDTNNYKLCIILSFPYRVIYSVYILVYN